MQSQAILKILALNYLFLSIHPTQRWCSRFDFAWFPQLVAALGLDPDLWPNRECLFYTAVENPAI